MPVTSRFAVTAGFALVAIAAGCSGATGPVGPSGAPGITGQTGPGGAAGPSGAPGTIGPSGAPGATGPSGAPGATGPSGAPGATGPSGAPGAPGASGAPGATGPSGAPGATGPSGAPGATGPSGAPGATGPSGAPGPTGPSGAPGPTGPSGAPGPTGPVGPSGAPAPTPSPATTFVTMSAVQPDIQCAFSQSSSTEVAVLDANDPNSYAVSIATTKGTVNADGSLNEIDLTTYGGASAYQAAQTAELPATFQPGNHRDVGAIAFAKSVDGTSQSYTWGLATEGQLVRYEDFAYNAITGTAAKSPVFSTAENTRPGFEFDVGTCSASDANAARRLLGLPLTT